MIPFTSFLSIHTPISFSILSFKHRILHTPSNPWTGTSSTSSFKFIGTNIPSLWMKLSRQSISTFTKHIFYLLPLCTPRTICTDKHPHLPPYVQFGSHQPRATLFYHAAHRFSFHKQLLPLLCTFSLTTHVA